MTHRTICSKTEKAFSKAGDHFKRLKALCTSKLVHELTKRRKIVELTKEDEQHALELHWKSIFVNGSMKMLEVENPISFIPEYFAKLRATGIMAGVVLEPVRIIHTEKTEDYLDDYCDERGWDIKTGIPAKKKLAELGLGFVAEGLIRRTSNSIPGGAM